MERKKSPRAFSLGLSFILLLTVRPAGATLGEKAAAVVSGRKVLAAGRAATMVQMAYTVEEIRSAAVTVRKYISPGGVVFAIAWRGFIHPDLTPLLGSYAGEYEAALKQTRRLPGLRRLQVKANRVVVEKWGQMRNLQGRAYLPALLPAGVNIDEIK